MAEGKLISFWSGAPCAGRQTLAKSLAQCWADEGRDVLLIQMGEGSTLQDPTDWVPRFWSLSPVLLRNFLAGPRGSYGCLSFLKTPDAVLWKEVLDLTLPAYAWTIVLGPQELSPDAVPILDASDLLLWVSQRNDDASRLFQGFLDRLTKFHIPHAYIHTVLTWASGPSTDLPEIVPGKRVIVLAQRR